MQAANNEFWSTSSELACLLGAVTRALHARGTDRGALAVAEVGRLAGLADHAMTVRFTVAAGSDVVALSVNQTPEPHHLAAFGLAREVAAHVGQGDANPFQNEQLRQAFARETAFLLQRLSEQAEWIDRFVRPDKPDVYAVRFFTGIETTAFWTGSTWVRHRACKSEDRKRFDRHLNKLVRSWRVI